jgi:hypothetical protein
MQHNLHVHVPVLCVICKIISTYKVLAGSLGNQEQVQSMGNHQKKIREK